jgi:hypothetical protein
VAGGVRRALADSGMTPVASVEKIIWGTEHASAAAVGVGASGCYGGASGRGTARWPGDTGGRECTERRRATGRRVLEERASGVLQSSSWLWLSQLCRS